MLITKLPQLPAGNKRLQSQSLYFPPGAIVALGFLPDCDREGTAGGGGVRVAEPTGGAGVREAV